VASTDALTRTYSVLDGDEGHPLEVTWGDPIEEADGAWFCEVSFAEAGKPTWRRRVGGVDAVQALYLGLQLAASDLYSHTQHFCWFERDDDLGLPVLPAVQEVVQARAERFRVTQRERELAREVIRSFDNGLARLTLNRPAALNALTTAMCRDMIEELNVWRRDSAIKAILIDHAGPRGFCAGGDIRMLAESGARDGVEARRFFATEYRLDALIEAYPKPVIAIMDGVVMGGGVGISLPARYRIATERTRFAMPETGIGLFPDVGAGWFLPKLPGRTGLWIALTGARLAAADCLHLGLATHAVESARLDGLKAALAEAPDEIERILNEFSFDPGHPPIAYAEADIDRLFAGDDLEAIFAALTYDGSEWAAAQLAAMAPKSPLSAKVAVRLIAGGLTPKSLADDLAVEYRLASRLVMRPDFHEGVRAVIVDKDNAPVWSPASLAEVSEALVDEMFAPMPDGQEWAPEGERDVRR